MLICSARGDWRAIFSPPNEIAVTQYMNGKSAMFDLS